MNKILKLAFTSLAWLALMPLAMATESDHGFSQLFVFGDSLSDPGNRFAVDGVVQDRTVAITFDPLVPDQVAEFRLHKKRNHI